MTDGKPAFGKIETGSGVKTFADARREDTPRLVAELVAAGESIYGVRVLTSTLEETYLEVVGEDGSR